MSPSSLVSSTCSVDHSFFHCCFRLLTQSSAFSLLGSVDGIRQVINIAAANPDYPIILQWTGGRAGGHHSCEDFHSPILATYSSIRARSNIVLLAGSGFGHDGAEDTYPYLSGEWSEAMGVQRMPFDGFLFGSRVMVAKEAHTSETIKQLIVDAQGVDDHQW